MTNYTKFSETSSTTYLDFSTLIDNSYYLDLYLEYLYLGDSEDGASELFESSRLAKSHELQQSEVISNDQAKPVDITQKVGESCQYLRKTESFF